MPGSIRTGTKKSRWEEHGRLEGTELTLNAVLSVPPSCPLPLKLHGSFATPRVPLPFL